MARKRRRHPQQPKRQYLLERQHNFPTRAKAEEHAAAERAPTPPSRHSGGTSGDLTVADHKTKTPVVPYGPSSAISSPPSVRSQAPKARSKATNAVTRQRKLVDRYVTHAYKQKTSEVDRSQVSPFQVGTRIEKAKDEVQSLRKRLLSHPAVEQANAQGKVVPPKGLAKIHRREEQYHAIEGPKGVSSSKESGIAPRSLLVGDKGLKALQRQEYFGNQGQVTRRLKRGEAGAHAKGEPSTLESLAIASIGIPGIGVGGDVAKLAELGARAIPELATKEGIAQLASKGAVKTGESVAARGAATKAAIKELPTVLKSSPKLLKTAAKGAPKATAEALKAAPKTVPAAAGRGALRGAQTTYQLGSGLGVLAATQKAGLDTKPGEVADAILKGTSAAISKHPLETAETTARAIPAAVTAPAALLYGVGQIPSEGTGPLEKTASAQFEGMFGKDGIVTNLLSGDPHKVQEAVQAQGALAFLTPLPALTRSKPYEALRTDVREAAAGARRLSGKGRQAPKGVEQSVFGYTDKRASRKRVQLSHSRTTNPHRISEARLEKAVLHGTTRRPALEKVPDDWGHTISTLLDAGIRDPEGIKLMRERGPKTEPHAEGKVNLDRALKIAEEHPEMFQSKPFQRALSAAERASKTTPAALAGMGEVARNRTQGNLFGVRPPEESVPFGARKYTSAKDREGAWKQVDQFEARIKELKAKQRVKGPKGKQTPRRTAEIKALEKRVAGLRKSLDSFTRPGQKTAAGERKFWDKRLEQEYIAKVQAKRKGSPLVEPRWTHHATFENAKLGMEPGSLPGKAGGKVYVRRGTLAEHDLVDRSLQSFVRGTIQMPRRRAGAAEFAREFVRQEKIPYTLGGKAQEIIPDSETWAKISSPKTKENPDGGQFDPKTYARFPLREWKTAVEDPFTTEADLSALLADAEAGRIRSHEPSIIVPRESVREFRAIANPERGPVTQFMNALGRTSTRLILGTNPSWVLAQIPAEGIPLLLAHPELINPLKTGSILKELYDFRKQNPEQAAIIEGAAGASPEITAGTLRSPMDLEKQGSFSPQPAMFGEAAKQLTRSKWGRAMRSTAKLEPFGLFDIKRQNVYRSVLLAAEADKQFRGWTSGVRGMFRTSAKLSEKFRNKSRAELWDWLSSTKEGKAELQKLADYVDNVQGNWTAFTRYERAFAPFAIFYPFLRYSLRWALWTFPRTHPLAATIAYTLGQVNSNELEKVLGAKPASPLQLAYPVVENAEGKASVLPGGSRIAPGQSVIQQAIVGGKPSQLIGGLNPILGAALTGLGGPGPFGDKPSNPAGWAAVDQLLSLPAPLRLANVHSEKVAAMLGITRPQPESVIAKAFEKLDPNKTMRQGLLPSLPQSGKDARMSNELSSALTEASANSKSHREDVAGDDSLTVQARQKQIKAMEARSDKAKAKIDGVLKKLGLDKEDAAAYERYKEALYGGAEESSIYSKGSIYEKGKIYESGGIYGNKGNNKALNYKPPGAGGIDLPDISGPLGAVLNPLIAAVSGEKAQAAEVPKPHRQITLSGPLDAGEKTFAKTVAKETGLKPETVAAWTLQEGGNSTGDYNRLNIGHTDSGALGLTADPGWKDPVQAGKLTAEFLKGNYGGASSGIQAILPAAKGKSASQQLDIIANSGWATDPNYASNLQGTLAVVGVKRGKPVPKKTLSRFRAGVVAANQLEKATLPYVWGGGHGSPTSSPTGGGLDCSGAVSYVLNKMGALKGSLTSGDMGSALKPGPGAVTVFYNPEHTFMRIGKKYFGTSTTNPAGGAGYIPVSTAGPEAMSGKYNIGHVPGLGKKVAVALGVPTGSSGAHATSTFPGMTISSSGTVATIDPQAGTVRKKSGFSNKPIEASPAERLKLVNEISEGNLSELGVSSGGDGVGPSAAQLAKLGEALQADRRKLLRR